VSSPRYVYSGCCADPSHSTNVRDEGYVNGRTYFVVNMVPYSRKGLKIKSLKVQCPEIFKMKEVRIKGQIHMGDKRSTRSCLCSFLSSSG
jgi:hypothetical protein